MFLGFLFLSGYHTLPRERLYWSQRENLGIELVKKAMTRDRYLLLKSVLHVANNEIPKEEKTKDFKIAPLYEKLNANFKKFGVHDEYLVVDEQMVKYFGCSSLKQFIRNKPIRFGLKNWAFCGQSGYCYHLKLYCGKEKDSQPHGPLGSRVVHQLIHCVQPSNSNVIVMDNFFCSHELLCELREKGLPAIGTMRENRTAKCPLAEDKTLKSEGRGSKDCKFDPTNKISIVKWLDNRPVIVGANFEIGECSKTAQRWSKQCGRITLQVPPVIQTYNTGMGGVDLMDSFVNAYRISVRSKKWYWCLFTVLADITISNAWIIFRKVNCEKMDLMTFKSNIALSYLKLGYRSSSILTSPKVTPPTNSIRKNQGGHYLASRLNQRRCQGLGCSSKPTTYCDKRNITLCKKCFPAYHQ